jgi:CRISPR-associated Csx10 family RAMP protein
MYIKIEAALQSNLMIGGKTLTSNYRDSISYIPGSVLRAAYARAILDRCSYQHEKNWLSYQEQEECCSCNWQKLCINFSKISFPTLYPSGSLPYPITARVKKYSLNQQDVVQDILRGRLRQGKLDQEAEWVKAEGFHKAGERVELVKTLVTRTAIDYRRHSAKNAALYSQNTVVGRLVKNSDEVSLACGSPQSNSRIEPVVFSGIMEMDHVWYKEFKCISNLRIGADITNGMGCCVMHYSESAPFDTLPELEERVSQFNQGLHPGDQDKEELFIIVDLLTDAYLCQEKLLMKPDAAAIAPSDVTNEVFLSYLETMLALPECYRLSQVFKHQELRRGFNTAQDKKADVKRRTGRLVVQAGAVFVYKVNRQDYQADCLFQAEQKGIGLHQHHGFGRIRICDEFHVQFDAQKGEM